MTAPPDGWPCEAYGDDPPMIEMGAWCFVSSLFSRSCLNLVVCKIEMTAGRQAVYQRICERAAAGDPTFAALAEVITSPDAIFKP